MPENRRNFTGSRHLCPASASISRRSVPTGPEFPLPRETYHVCKALYRHPPRHTWVQILYAQVDTEEGFEAAICMPPPGAKNKKQEKAPVHDLLLGVSRRIQKMDSVQDGFAGSARYIFGFCSSNYQLGGLSAEPALCGHLRQAAVNLFLLFPLIYLLTVIGNELTNCAFRACGCQKQGIRRL